jgi:zinc transporter 1/2/3
MAETTRDASSSWADVPTKLLLAELRRRQDEGEEQPQPECGTKSRGWYDTPAHVFALFLILTLSTLGATRAPVLASSTGS